MGQIDTTVWEDEPVYVRDVVFEPIDTPTAVAEVARRIRQAIVLGVLRDGGYRDTEILRWLFTADPSLTVTRDGSREPVPNARPVDALQAHQAREILRRAQAMAY